MDEINDFMDFTKPFERINLAAPTKKVSPDPNSVDVELTKNSAKRSIDSDHMETDYATEYRREEVQLMIQVRIEIYRNKKTIAFNFFPFPRLEVHQF